MAAALNEAFRLLQAGHAAAALEASRRIVAREPANARARLAEGIALRMLGRRGEALAALESGARIDPADAALAYETGVEHRDAGRDEAALAAFDRARALRGDHFAAHFQAGALRLARGQWDAAAACFEAVLRLRPDEAHSWLHLALAHRNAGRLREAEAAHARAVSAAPGHAPARVAFGQFLASRGRFDEAARLFTQALPAMPEDEALPIFLAQCELLAGRWTEGWSAYRAREPRRRFESERARQGRPYRLPERHELAGRAIDLVAEQGLGDTLFFLRWAPLAQAAGARLRFSGHPRLHAVLARTALFDSLHDAPPADEAWPLLVGDLPAVFADVDPTTVPSLRAAPDPALVAHWEARLRDAGPHPWIGITWRAGTRPEVVAHALHKEVPLEAFAAALRPVEGTVLALQRDAADGEIARASAALGRPVHDFGAAVREPEDTLAILSLLDRHAGVSSTNMHLAAMAGRDADVLVPFPPEWRWRPEGASPWFPGMRVHRQALEGGWDAALAALQAAWRASSGRQ